MARPGDRHVVPDGGKWKVIAPGSDRASAVTDTQAEAIDRAREIIGNAGGGELAIHNQKGQIREKDTIPPAPDPRRTRG